LVGLSIVVDEIQKSLLEVSLEVNTIRDFMDGGEYKESLDATGKCRLRLAECIQKLDKLSVSILRAKAVESVGFRPQPLGGGSKDVTKGCSDDVLISEILRGKLNARELAQHLKPEGI
jgi:hypothetical protein